MVRVSARFELARVRVTGVDCSCVVPIDSDPGDDTKGKERFDKNNCTLGYYPVTEQIVSLQPTSTSLSTVLIITSDTFQLAFNQPVSCVLSRWLHK